MVLTLIYIGNTHYGNRMSRNIMRLKQETEDLRADYTTLKSDYMEASKQSEVARKVAALGMVESSSPPFRITVPAGHLEASALELMPVLTADTLAARAARDSSAAHVADSLAGRHRYGNTADSGPEIIAPPQPLDGDSLATATAVAPARTLVKHAAGKPKNKAKKQVANTLRKSKAASVKVKSVQKSTTQHKSKQRVNIVPPVPLHRLSIHERQRQTVDSDAGAAGLFGGGGVFGGHYVEGYPHPVSGGGQMAGAGAGAAHQCAAGAGDAGQYLF